MKSYATIKAEIAKLEKQAEAARKAEIAGVISRIKEAIAAYGLTAQDLGFGSAAGRAARSNGGRGSAAARTTVGVPKYRDPQSGKTWTGRGKPPTWIAGVKDRTPFLIEGASQGGETGRRGAGKGRGRGAAKATNGVKRGGRKAGGRKGSMPAEKTAAVEMESGAAE